jgi:hypothetical protein
MIHELKTLPEYFNAVEDESKTFEVRKNDRPFHVGDYLALNEYDGNSYTGRCMMVQITYILDSPAYCKDETVVLGIIGCRVQPRNDQFKQADYLYKGIPVYGGDDS